MNLEKVIFWFFITLAAALNFGFFLGPLTDPTSHNGVELLAAVIVSLIATVLKFGDRTQLGAVHLATSLVADLQLIVAAGVWVLASQTTATGITENDMSVIVSMSGGALLANILSVVLLVSEILQSRR